MSWLSRVFGIVVVMALILPSWGQDVKKDTEPGVKKTTDAKKTADKKKNTKKSSKTKAKKKKEEINPEDKVAYGQMVTGTLKQLDANSQKDFTVAVMLPDPKKIFDLNVWMQQNIVFWQANQLASQQQQMFSVARANTIVGKQQALMNYNRSLMQYNVTLAQRQMQLAQRETEIYTPKDFELRAAEKIKVRTATPPTEYDEKGNMKRWTLKELKTLKKGSKLPGYPAEFDALRPNQTVAVYLAKQAFAEVKTTKKGIKLQTGIKLDQDEEKTNTRPEVVMIVVIQDAKR